MVGGDPKNFLVQNTDWEGDKWYVIKMAEELLQLNHATADLWFLIYMKAFINW